MKNLILILITVMTVGCSVFMNDKKTVVNGVKVRIFKNEEISAGKYFVQVGVVNSDLQATEPRIEEKQAMDQAFHEEAIIACQSENYRVDPKPRTVRDVINGSVTFTYQVWYYMASNVLCEQ